MPIIWLLNFRAEFEDRIRDGFNDGEISGKLEFWSRKRLTLKEENNFFFFQ